MIRITVPALPVRNMKGIAKASGKPYDFNLQTIYCHTSDENGNPLPYPEKAEVTLETGQAPYMPGDYTLNPSSLYVDRSGRLAISPRLKPLQPK